MPSAEQLEATQALIDAMDLTTAATDEDGFDFFFPSLVLLLGLVVGPTMPIPAAANSNSVEALKPKHTYNPALQNLYRAVLHRVQHPDDPNLPPVCHLPQSKLWVGGRILTFSSARLTPRLKGPFDLT